MLASANTGVTPFRGSPSSVTRGGASNDFPFCPFFPMSAAFDARATARA